MAWGCCGGRGGFPRSLIPRTPGLFPKEGRIRGAAGWGRVTGTTRIAGLAAGTGLETDVTPGAATGRGMRVATTGRRMRLSEGRIPRVLVGTQLAALGWTGGPVWSGCRARKSPWRTRAPVIGPLPNRSCCTATTALGTAIFLYTVIVCTLTVVVRLTTTLLTTRGPPQPPHQGRWIKPAEPHQGMHGSPQPRATQPTSGPPTLTATPDDGVPRKATRAGA